MSICSQPFSLKQLMCMQAVMLGFAKLYLFFPGNGTVPFSHTLMAGVSKNDPPSDAYSFTSQASLRKWKRRDQKIEKLNCWIDIFESSYVLRPLQTILYWVSKVLFSPNSLHLTGKNASIYMNLVTFWQ